MRQYKTNTLQVQRKTLFELPQELKVFYKNKI